MATMLMDNPEGRIELLEDRTEHWGPYYVHAYRSTIGTDQRVMWMVWRADALKTYGMCKDGTVLPIVMNSAQECKHWIDTNFSLAGVSVMGKQIVAMDWYENVEAAMVGFSRYNPTVEVTPEYAVQEREAIITLIGRDLSGMAAAASWGVMTPLITKEFLRRYVKMMYEAKVIIWDMDLWDLCTQNSDDVFGRVPVKRDDVAVPPQYWCFDRDATLVTGEAQKHFDLHDPASISGMFILPADQFADMTLQAGRAAKVDDLVLAHKVKQGGVVLVYVMSAMHKYAKNPIMLRIVPEILYSGKECTESYTQYIAAHRFMNMTLVEQAPQKLPNHKRREYRMAKQEPPEVYKVRLRKTVYEKGDSPQEEGAKRNFNCHFVVGGLIGRWRSGKHYADGRVGDPEWVKPYVKGDLSKPLNKPSGRIAIGVVEK